MNHEASTVDEYIASAPAALRPLLESVRAAIRKAAPEATETISYGMPTFKQGRNVVHFAGYTNHIGFYPGAECILHFQEELSPYPSGKGSVQFPLDRPLPLDLITRLTAQRISQLA